MSEAAGPSLWDVCVGGLWCVLRRVFFFVLGGGAVEGAAAGPAALPVEPAARDPHGYGRVTPAPLGGESELSFLLKVVTAPWNSSTPAEKACLVRALRSFDPASTEVFLNCLAASSTLLL